jgi:hypothetical protein
MCVIHLPADNSTPVMLDPEGLVHDLSSARGLLRTIQMV